MNLAELLLEAVEGRHVGALDRRLATRVLLATGVLALGLGARTRRSRRA